MAENVNIRELLQQHWVRLMKDLSVDDLVQHLYAAKVFTESMLEEVHIKKLTRDKNFAFLTILQRRGPKALPAFLKALCDTEQEELCELLSPGFMPANKTDINLNPVLSNSGKEPTPPLTITIPANTSTFGNVVTQTEPSPYPSPNATPKSPPSANIKLSRPGSRPNSLYGSIGLGLDSLTPGYSALDTSISPESPVKDFKTCFDIHVNQIPNNPIPSNVLNLVFNNTGVYRNFTEPKGLCLIVNNRDFSNSAIGLHYREGSDRDCMHLSWLFEKLGYKVIIEKDLEAEALEQRLETFAQNPEHEYADSAVIAILSHGQEQGIYGTDGLVVKTKTLMDFLDGDRCPNLIKKPKLFFIQACRGRTRQIGVELPATLELDSRQPRSRHGSGVERKRSLTPDHLDESPLTRTASGGVGPRRLHIFSPPNKSPREHEDAIRDIDQPDPPVPPLTLIDPHGAEADAEPSPVRRTIPKYSDMLISYSTIPGHVSFRQGEGTWYIRAIIDVFSQHAHEKDIHALLTMVNRKVATCATSDYSFKQMPAPVNHLMKDFYFFPGIEEDQLFEIIEQGGDEMDIGADTNGNAVLKLPGNLRKSGRNGKTVGSRFSTL